jgi:hypothetical protein
VFSAGKPLVGIAIAVLETRGAVDVTAPVARYWAEFARHGEEDVTVLDVLTHRSGLQLREIERDWRKYGDWAGIISRIKDAEPAYPRGTLAYQAMGFGWILGEVVRRISGLPIEEYPEEGVLSALLDQVLDNLLLASIDPPDHGCNAKLEGISGGWRSDRVQPALPSGNRSRLRSPARSARVAPCSAG